MELLTKGAEELNLFLDDEQIERFQGYYRELVSWNQRMNLTAIVDYREAQVKHFLDSLTVSLVIPENVKPAAECWTSVLVEASPACP